MPRAILRSTCKPNDPNCIDAALARVLPGPGVQNLSPIRVSNVRTADGIRQLTSFSFTITNSRIDGQPIGEVLLRAQIDQKGGFDASSELLVFALEVPLAVGETNTYDVSVQFSRGIIGLWWFTPVLVEDPQPVEITALR